MIWFAAHKEPVPTLYLFTETATVAMLGCLKCLTWCREEDLCVVHTPANQANSCCSFLWALAITRFSLLLFSDLAHESTL